MNALDKASLDLRAVLLLADSFRDGTASERKAAADAVLQARAALASERARLAMQPKGAAS